MMGRDSAGPHSHTPETKKVEIREGPAMVLMSLIANAGSQHHHASLLKLSIKQVVCVWVWAHGAQAP